VFVRRISEVFFIFFIKENVESGKEKFLKIFDSLIKATLYMSFVEGSYKLSFPVSARLSTYILFQYSKTNPLLKNPSISPCCNSAVISFILVIGFPNFLRPILNFKNKFDRQNRQVVDVFAKFFAKLYYVVN